MARIFKTPFGAQGDTEQVPEAPQGDGSVSLTQGFGYDYEREYEDPAAKDIRREVMNGLFHDITEAIGDIQLTGVAKWDAAAAPYPAGAVVWHDGAAWMSTAGNNSSQPGVGTNWEKTLTAAQLASNAPGQGSDLIAHTGTSDTVTEALDKRVIYVDTIADLQSLDTNGMVDGQQVQVKEYHAGTGVGGGEFYLTQDAQLEHDDGTVFDTQGAQFVRVAGSVVTPLSFGAVSDSAVDSSEAINKFFQCAALTPNGRYVFEFTGTYGTSQTLTLTDFDQKRMAMDASVQALSPLDVVFKFDGCRRAVFPGRLHVSGTGGSGLAGNTCIDGIHITGCGGALFEFLHVVSGQGWGVSDTGGNHMMHIQQIVASNFGASNRSTRVHSIDVVSFSKTGTSNSQGQRSVLTVSDPENLPSTIDGYVVVAGFPHAIQSVDVGSSTVEVFPWVNEVDEVPGEYGLVYGGCVSVGSSTSAKIEIGLIMPTRCGIGAHLRSTSAPNVGRFVGQFNGVSLALGGFHGSRTFSGVDISSVYFEAEAVAEIVSNSTSATFSNGSSLTCVTAGNPSMWFALAARADGGAVTSRRYFPVEILAENVRWPAQSFYDFASSVDGINKDWGEYTLSIREHNTHPQHVQGIRSEITLNLTDDQDFRRLKGFLPVSAIVTGAGPNGNYTGTLYVAAQDGYTINGMESPIRLASNPNPFRVTAWFTSETNWRIAVEDLTPPTLFE